jgi:hypothetical protein
MGMTPGLYLKNNYQDENGGPQTPMRERRDEIRNKEYKRQNNTKEAKRK